MLQNNKLKEEEGNINADDKPSKNIKRIDLHYISDEVKQLLNFEKGFSLTIKELLLRPGKCVRAFIFDDRNKYVKPLVFLIFTSFIFTIITSYLQIDYSFFNIDKIEPLKGKIRSKEIGDWTNSNLGYTNLIIGLFVALWIKIFFKNDRYNIYEILVLLCYVLGEAMLILGVFILLANLFTSSIIGLIGIFTYFAYTIWAIGQFFGEKKVISYIKSALTYVLGNFTYLIVLILIAYLLKKLTIY